MLRSSGNSRTVHTIERSLPYAPAAAAGLPSQNKGPRRYKVPSRCDRQGVQAAASQPALAHISILTATTETSMRTILSACIRLAILAGAAAQTLTQGGQSTQTATSIVDFNQLAKTLRTGGHVILVRHGATFSNQADTDPFTLADISKQRNLNDKGKELAKAFG